MLKRKLLKNIGIALSCLLVIAIVTIFPKKDEDFIVKANTKAGIIYLLDDNNYVSRLDIIYNGSTNDELIEEMISILTINNEKAIRIRSGFSPIIPENTKLLDYEIKDKLATLNFSKEILTIKKDLEEKMIEAIIFSVTSIKDIDAVKILVEDKQLEKLPILLKGYHQ